jgi:amidophosphoribosyltransferase
MLQEINLAELLLLLGKKSRVLQQRLKPVRYSCGKALAKNDDVNIDFVAGIPDSGIGHAIGNANAKRLRYKRPFVKYTPTWPRSFMPQSQEVRDLVAKMKLIPVKEIIKDQRILFCEDSIVRGTQLKDNVHLLYERGAKEVHMRPACPTLIYPCEFLNFSQSRSTLGLTTLKFQRIEDLVKATGIPKEKLCTHCWDGSSYF